jgi:hypothetical protein
MFTVKESLVIPARAEKLYNIVADYRNSHQHILPKQYFTNLEVEQGGIGTGTRIKFSMKAFGSKRVFHQEVLEPQPGKVLMEKDLETDTATTFTFEPVDAGKMTYVTISTAMPKRAGLTGWLERTMSGAFLRGVYAKELKLLAEYVKSQAN